MSRGLGKLQREILDTLDEAREQEDSYKGGEGGSPGWVRTYGAWVRIADDVYDLRQNEKYLARRHNALDYGTIEKSFAASWSRATRSLVTAGYLDRLLYLPIIGWFRDRYGLTSGPDSTSLRLPIVERDPTGEVIKGALRFVTKGKRYTK